MGKKQLDDPPKAVLSLGTGEEVSHRTPVSRGALCRLPLEIAWRLGGWCSGAFSQVLGAEASACMGHRRPRASPPARLPRLLEQKLLPPYAAPSAEELPAAPTLVSESVGGT